MTAAAAKNIRLLCLDADGVLTDGSIIIDDNGIESKRFHVRDGAGIRMWLKLGFELAIITGRRGKALQYRAKELGINHLIQGSAHKLADLTTLLETLGLQPENTAMLGDDLPDLPLLKAVGYPMAVADAVAEIRDSAAFITTCPGGHGAVREAIEHLLRAKNCWQQAMEVFV